MAQGIGPNSPQFTRPDMWEQIRNHANEGWSRAETARHLGYRADYFCKLLAAHPDKDPFDQYGVVVNYVRDTGEQFKTALVRMAKEGYCLSQAARLIGFTQHNALRYAMRVRGIKVVFPAYDKSVKRRSTKPEKLTAPRKAQGGVHPWKQQADREAAQFI